MFDDGLPVFAVYSVFSDKVMWEMYMLIRDILQLWYVLTNKNAFWIKLFTLSDWVENSKVRLSVTAGT